jgi:hypothetical protein
VVLKWCSHIGEKAKVDRKHMLLKPWKVDNRDQRAECREQRADSREQTTGSKDQAAAPTAENREHRKP